MKAPIPPAYADIAQPTWRDARDEFIARVARGKSFVDVGGLWGTVRERVSSAHAAGASSLRMIDVAIHADPLWESFRERMVALGVPSWEEVPADVHRLESDFYGADVVHCSGVLYHSPDPMRTLHALKRLTREYLVLSCSVVPRVIRNRAGTLALPDATWVCLPALSGREAAVMREHWRPQVGDLAIGITTPFPGAFDPDDWGPWYWLPTVDAFRALARFVGFRVLDEGPIWSGNAHTLLLEVPS